MDIARVQEVVPRYLRIDQIVRSHRSPDLCRPRKALESLRRHSDYREQRPIYIHRPAYNVCCAPEARIPELVADHKHWLALCLLLGEGSALKRRDAQYCEVIRSHVLA